MTRNLNEDFKGESEEIVTDITGQINAFEGFTEQEKKIEALAERIQEGRERIKLLGGRVEVVKERVSGWETAEEEWQNKTRKRLKVLWILISIFGAIFLGLMFLPARTQGPGVMKGLNTSGLLGKMPDMETIKNETWTPKKEAGDALEGLINKKEELDDDPRLRAFDEL